MHQEQYGMTMGNSLPSFMGNLFLDRFDSDMSKKLDNFPKICIRHVDDVAAIFNVQNVETLNKKY